MAVIIKESLAAFRSMAPHVPGCEALFLRLGLRYHVRLLLLYQSPCGNSITRVLDLTAELAVEFCRLIVLGDFNLPFLGVGVRGCPGFHRNHDFLSQVILILTRNNGRIPNLVFLLEQCLHDLELVDLSLVLLSLLDHSLMSMSFLRTICPHPCREAGPIGLVCPLGD